MNRRRLQRLRGDGTGWLVVGGVVAGLAAYLFQIVGTRALGDRAYAPISVLWTIQYLVLSTVLVSIETLVTRDTLDRREGRGNSHGQAKVWLVIVAVALGLSALCFLARDALLAGMGDLAAVVGLMVLSLGLFVVVRGRLAGSGRFRRYGLVTASESLVRLALAVVVVALSATVRSLAWALPFGGAAAACLGLRRVRIASNPEAAAALPAPAIPETAAAGQGAALAAITAANAAAQVLLAGGPLVLVFLGAGPSQVSIFFVTVTAARVPVVLALGGLLSRVLPAFRALGRRDGGRALRRVAAQVVAGAALLAAAGAGLAARLGRATVAFFFGPTFAPPDPVVAGIAAAVVLATGGMLLNQLVVAQQREHRLPWPWLSAVATAAVTLSVAGGDPSLRVTVAFVIAEVVALAGLLAAAVLPARTAPA